jgi:UDP-3-O-[3-hydroxymyristoyl] glucosamine N-acyltransferase
VVKIGKGSSIGPHAVVFYDFEIGENVLLETALRFANNAESGIAESGISA